MKFSENTLSILKNFSTINPSVMFKSGNTIRTISPQKTVMASATIAETLTSNAGVYDLSRFLGTLSLFTDPEVEFMDKQFSIKSGSSTVKYTYAAESMIVTPPDSDISIPDPDVVVNLPNDDLQKVIRAASVLQLGEIAFRGDGENISIVALDTKNPTADGFDIVLSTTTDKNFLMVIKVENLKLLQADYTVSLSSKGLAHFKSDKVQYFIAIEKNSTFGA
jgi:hypothetical protein